MFNLLITCSNTCTKSTCFRACKVWRKLHFLGKRIKFNTAHAQIGFRFLLTPSYLLHTLVTFLHVSGDTVAARRQVLEKNLVLRPLLVVYATIPKVKSIIL